MIVLLGAVIVGGTGAFFSDTETSSGNIFTAGSIDLKVDHTFASYNGEVCRGGECNKIIVSDDNTVVVENANAPAAELSFIHPGWTANLDGGHPADDSEWIWAVDGVTNPLVNEEFTFKRTFTWNGPATTATLYVASDNSHIAKVNGVTVGTDATEQNFRTTDEDTYAVASIVPGVNTIEVKVKNWGLAGSTARSNPAGVLFKLVINGDCFRSGQYAPGGFCELWAEKDLDENDQFFNFLDVKAGDYGRNVISLHVYDNDAWACLLVSDKDDQENTLLDPEVDAGDGVAEGLPAGLGELSQYLEFVAWVDDNDGTYEAEDLLTPTEGVSLAALTSSIAAMDSSTDQFLTSTTTAYIGLAWCAGDIDVVGQDINCDGGAMPNDAQSDSFTASLTAYAEQVRNNDEFQCSTLLPPVVPIDDPQLDR